MNLAEASRPLALGSLPALLGTALVLSLLAACGQSSNEQTMQPVAPVEGSPTVAAPPPTLPRTPTTSGQQPPRTAPAKAGAATTPWTSVPEGWTFDPAPRSMRFATFLIADEAGPVELAISKFPGDVGGMLMNVNRWRRQIGLGAVPDSELDGMLKTMVVPGFDAVSLLIEGATQHTSVGSLFEKDADRTWFVKATAAPEVIARHHEDVQRFAAGFRTGGERAQAPEGGAAPTAGTRASSDAPWGSLPEGWSLGQARQMRLATLLVPDGEARRELAVSRFPGRVGGLLANVNRWRQQIGLGPVEQSQLSGMTKTFALPGFAGTELLLEGASKHTLVFDLHEAAADRTWFVKLTDSPEVIARLRGPIGAFARSFRAGR